jgi:hypothetical protein
MTKYRIGIGAFITEISNRVYIVSADNEEEAFEKAKDRFEKAWSRSKRMNDIGEIQLDFIEQYE